MERGMWNVECMELSVEGGAWSVEWMVRSAERGRSIQSAKCRL